MLTSSARLSALRLLMRSATPPLSAYIIPSQDEHQSEYVPARDKRREWLSGFTGSAGTAVVTATSALLWTDARYFLQAESELDSAIAGWSLMRDRQPGIPTVESWLATTLTRGDAVGADPRLFSVNALRRMGTTLAHAGVVLRAPHPTDLVDIVWKNSREMPLPSSAPLRAHPANVAGETVADKLIRVRTAMAEKGAATLVITALDEVAWLYNVRGGDVECCPVALAFALVTLETATLFIDINKVTIELQTSLKSDGGVQIEPYEDFSTFLKHAQSPILLDPNAASGSAYASALNLSTDDALHRLLNNGRDLKPKSSDPPSSQPSPSSPPSSSSVSSILPSVIESSSPLSLMKAAKNAAERDGMRACHIRDAVALVRFFAWLEIAVNDGVDTRFSADSADKYQLLSSPLTEYTAGQALDGFRAELSDFISLSFPSIVGWKSNGAIVHYRPEEGTAALIKGRGLLLVDSGGQYIDGTTDVTRTVCLGGEPTAHECLTWTSVLKGHINLACAIFPAGTGGVALDALARAPLWKVGIDYKHGTGHGVGAALNVHEGPHGLANVPRSDYSGGLHEHFTITDEPGYYEDGNFGIRIENVMLVVKKKLLPSIENITKTTFLGLEPLTLVPLGGSLLDISLLSIEEKLWLNEYNSKVITTIAPLLTATKDIAALQWLQRHGKPITI
jgi:Xaa-Pro aminopeptidase